jgi:hypothetical protein
MLWQISRKFNVCMNEKLIISFPSKNEMTFWKELFFHFYSDESDPWLQLPCMPWLFYKTHKYIMGKQCLGCCCASGVELNKSSFLDQTRGLELLEKPWKAHSHEFMQNFAGFSLGLINLRGKSPASWSPHSSLLFVQSVMPPLSHYSCTAKVRCFQGGL